MSTALVPPASQWESREMVETLKQTVCRGASDAQFKMFLEVCKATGLNPFLKEIWYIPNVGVMAGRDGYLRVANEHPMFDGMETRVDRDDKNIPIKATCSVWRKDRAHPITCEAFYNEYKKGSSVWQTYPSAMISKVAEVLALKRSFSINGVVTEEEMGHDGGPPQETPTQIAQRQIEANNQRRIAEGKAPIVEANPVAEHPAFGDMPPDYADRHAALILEANAALDDFGDKVQAEAKRKRGDISFAALKKFKEMKAALREASGTDETYYQLLSVAGVDHADALNTVEGREVYKAMTKALKTFTAAKQTQTLEQQLEHHKANMAEGDWNRAIGNAGFTSIQEIIDSANGTQLDALLRELRPTE